LRFGLADVFGFALLGEVAFLLEAACFFVTAVFVGAGFLTGLTDLAEAAFFTVFLPPAVADLLAGLIALAAPGFFFDFGFLADVGFFVFCGLTVVFDSRANR
jgi:hypothetical protein